MKSDNGKMGDRKGAEQQRRTHPWLFPLQIGFFAGIIWGTIRWLFYEMKFTVELPGYLLEPFFQHAFLHSGWGYVIGIAGFALFSMLAALLYKAALGKFRGPWPGVFYGLAWWALMFVLLGPMMGMTGKMMVVGWNTIFTELCVFTLWGLFIGYSIAFEFTDEASREPVSAE